MNTEHSVTEWIAEVKLGQSGGAHEELWRRYFHRLVGLARLKLGGVPRGAADEEDVAISALTAFFDAARQGRFPLLHNRHDLWPLLVKITARKALDQKRHILADKRGGGNVRGNSAILPTDADGGWYDALIDAELGPDDLVALSEQCHRLMDRLPDDRMRSIARLRLEGYTNAEIAVKLGVVERTVERKVGMIRDYWAEAVGCE